MHIGEKSIAMAAEQVVELLAAHRANINVAFIRAAGDLDVTLKVKFKPWKGSNKIMSSISFTAEKITDQTDGIVDEDQGEMFPEGER